MAKVLDMKKILVVGSLNKDLTIQTNIFPHEGETVTGLKFSQADGGKGANQAVQAARLGASVDMVGKVGNDIFGDSMLKNCDANSVNTSYVLRNEEPSGVAVIILNEKEGGNKDNRIIIAPGANNELTINDVTFLEKIITDYAYVILQFEIPMVVNEYVAKLAHTNGVKVVVNPAPSQPISNSFLQNIDYFIPNEHEFYDATGEKAIKDGELYLEGIKQGASKLFATGVKKIIITLGSKGAYFINKDKAFLCESVKVDKVVDPTAAGDSFLSSFVTFLNNGYSHEDAMLIATAVGSLTIQKLGAMPSLCNTEELSEYIKKIKDERYKNISIS